MKELLLPQVELAIPNPSPELRVKAIETLPIPIEFGEVIFNASGIGLYGGGGPDESVRDEYYKKCREGGIIPNSTLKISSRDGLFYPRRGEPVEIAYNGWGIDDKEADAAIREAVVQSLIRGGRFAAIIYNIGGDAVFTNFKQAFLHRTLDQGYEISSADLALTSYRLTGYNEGTYYGVTLFVTPEKIRVATEGREFDKYDALKAWFEELRGQQKLPQF